MKWIVPLLVVLAVLACTPQQPPLIEPPTPIEDRSSLPLNERVDNVPNEIMFHDVLVDNIPGNELKIFGIGIGDTEEQLKALHGEADKMQYFQFGTIGNLQYNFGAEDTAVLYNLQNGVVAGILITPYANDLVASQFKGGSSIADMYGAFGQPTNIVIRHLESAYIYDELGYEVYIRRKAVQRVYITTPNRGLDRPGKEAGSCEEGNFSAVSSHGECVEFTSSCDVPADWDIVESCDDLSVEQECPVINTAAKNAVSEKCRVFDSPCDVPEGWDVVESCDEENTAPIFCIQVITPAIDPSTDECTEFATPCDVPNGWETVDVCPPEPSEA